MFSSLADPNLSLSCLSALPKLDFEESVSASVANGGVLEPHACKSLWQPIVLGYMESSDT